MTPIWTNMANILGDRDNLNEWSIVHYVLIGRKTNEWTDFPLFSIPWLNFIELEIPYDKNPKAILSYTLKIIC